MNEKQDHEKYHRLSQPFESAAKAEAALDAFFEDLYEIREKHNLPDLMVVVRIPLPEGDSFTTVNVGNELYGEMMAAFAMGRETSKRQERSRRLASGNHVTDREVK